MLKGKSTVSVVEAIMRKKLDEQSSIAFKEDYEVNSMRVKRMPPHFSNERESKTFAYRELIQNPKDFVEEVINHKDTVMKRKPNRCGQENYRVEWVNKGVLVLAIEFHTEGIEITQIGGPLSLDVIGSGTNCKEEEEGNSGGFGDGMKTGIHALLWYGCSVDFHFDAVKWEWVFKKFAKFSRDVHMGTVITVDKSAEIDPRDLPYMRTTIGFDQSTMKLNHGYFMQALCCFPKLLFKMVDDPESRCIVHLTDGAWREKSCFEPKVKSIAGMPVRIPDGPVVMVADILYPIPGSFADCNPDFVMCVPGRGTPHDGRPIFKNQMRVVDGSLLAVQMYYQATSFCKVSEERDKCAVALMPLLEGGDSLLFNRGRCELLLHYAYALQSVARRCVLVKKLSPKTWGPNKQQEIKLLEQRADNVVLCSEATLKRACYLQFISLQKPEDVILIDSSVACARVFYATPIDQLEHRAVSAVTEMMAKASNPICKRMDKVMEPIVSYIVDSSEVPTVTLITAEAPKKVVPYNFARGNTIIIYQHTFDPEAVLRAVQSVLHNTNEETKRGVDCVMHFMHNEIRTLALSTRVKETIKRAKEDAPIDLGTKRKRDDEISDDSDSDDEWKKLMGKKIKTKKGKGKKSSYYDATPAKPQERKAEPSQKRRSSKRTSTGTPKDKKPDSSDDEGEPECVWDETNKIYVSDQGASELPEGIEDALAIFEEAVELMRDHSGTGRCQIYPAHLPDASWRGLHSSDGVILINLAYCCDKAAMLVTMSHEVAHEYSPHHDKQHEQAMERCMIFVTRALLA